MFSRHITFFFFFFNDTATTEIYTLSLHDALPIYFSRASPFSKLSPIILSMLMNRWTALAMKLAWPVMLHVTAVWLPAGLKVNSAMLVAANGFRNSSWIMMRSLGRLSVDRKSVV